MLRKDRKRAEKRQEEAKGKRADRKQLVFPSLFLAIFSELLPVGVWAIIKC